MKFVNKNAIKSDFWGDCVEVSRKFSKNPRFWQKSISTLGRNFEKYFYRGARTHRRKSQKLLWGRENDIVGAITEAKSKLIISNMRTHMKCHEFHKNEIIWFY